MEKLTPKEKEVLNLLVRGKSNKEISEILEVSYFTIRNHVHAILQKLNFKDRKE